MTVKEAMSAVREACTTYAENYCDFQSGEYKQFDVACEMAIEALQKQEPKKSKMRIVCIDLRCPACNQALSSSYPHCPNCGQAIDWSGQEESEE